MRAGHPQARSEISGCDARDPLRSFIAESSDRPAEDLVVADLVLPYEGDGLEPAGRERDAVLEHDAAAGVVVHADIAVRASRRRDARMDDDLRAVEPIGVDAERRRAARRRDIAVLDDGMPVAQTQRDVRDAAFGPQADIRQPDRVDGEQRGDLVERLVLPVDQRQCAHSQDALRARGELEPARGDQQRRAPSRALDTYALRNDERAWQNVNAFLD